MLEFQNFIMIKQKGQEQIIILNSDKLTEDWLTVLKLSKRE